ncbi:MAG: TolB-like 6-bladed beta-propeller domain-containing protein [Tannerella sp.]|nr:TolB-like 6-bladed beta-propeller domain-containing protein [Tannerella sp.]
MTLVLLPACSFQNSDRPMVFTEHGQLTCTPVSYPDILGITMQLVKHDSLLLLNDFRGDTLIHVFNVKNGRLLTKLVSVGNGPDEMKSPLEIYIRKNRLYIHYRQVATLYSLSLDSLLLPDRKLKKHFQASGETSVLFPLSDSLFIAAGYFQQRYAVFNHCGEKVHEFGDYPAYWSREKDLSLQVRAMFHQVRFEKHPTEALFLACSSHTMEIYDYGEGIRQPVLIASLWTGKYNYSWMDDGTYLSTRKGDDVERGTVSVAVSSRYIYAVHNPGKNEQDDAGSQIRIIDWKGNPVKILHFDKPVACLTVDEKENRVYLIAEDPDNTLLYAVSIHPDFRIVTFDPDRALKK